MEIHKKRENLPSHIRAAFDMAISNETDNMKNNTAYLKIDLNITNTDRLNMIQK